MRASGVTSQIPDPAELAVRRSIAAHRRAQVVEDDDEEGGADGSGEGKVGHVERRHPTGESSHDAAVTGGRSGTRTTRLLFILKVQHNCKCTCIDSMCIVKNKISTLIQIKLTTHARVKHPVIRMRIAYRSTCKDGYVKTTHDWVIRT